MLLDWVRYVSDWVRVPKPLIGRIMKVILLTAVGGANLLYSNHCANLVPRGLQRQTPGREYRRVSLAPLRMSHFLQGAWIIVSYTTTYWSLNKMKQPS